MRRFLMQGVPGKGWFPIPVPPQTEWITVVNSAANDQAGGTDPLH